MNYPVWYLPEVGGGLLIALIAILHVFVSHFAVGGGLYLIYAEKKGLREHRQDILAFTKRHARFFLLLTMVFGSITGVGIWFIIALVNPAATSLLIHIFVFGWAAEWVFFVVEIVAAFVYFYMFDKMSPANHLRVGWVYFISAWMSLFLINGIICFMLTPGSWLENGNFWSGFFNPSFWPSLGLRTFIAIMLAGVYGYLSASFTRETEVRLAMTRFSGAWSLGALLASVPFAWWYVAALPEPAMGLVLGKSPTIVAAVQWGTIGTAVLLVIILLAGIIKPVLNLRPVAAAAMICALISMGAFEWIREAARRPYAINEVMYSNMIRKDDLSRLADQGFLQTAVWVQGRDLNQDTQKAAGEELFIQQCYACHTAGGLNNDLKVQTARMSYSAMSSYIKRIHEVRYFMPPFAGTEAEAEALAAYLVGEWHGKDVALPAKQAGVISGDRLFEQHCAACHVPEDLHETLAALEAGEVVDLLGRLDEISAEMEPFTGTEEEAKVLAGFLRGEGTAPVVVVPDGALLFEEQCAVCHDSAELGATLTGWDRPALRDALDRLEELSEEMPPYEGSPEEKDALADHLFTLGRNQ